MHSLKSSLAALDLSSRKKRRNAISLTAALLVRVRDEEEAYMNRIPDNLQGSDAYSDSECFISLLDEAIDLVASVYD